MSKDPGVKADSMTGGGKTDYYKPISGDPPVEEHDLDGAVTNLLPR